MAITVTITVSNVTGGDTTINRTDLSVPLGEIKTIIEDWLNGLQEAEQVRFLELASPPTAPGVGTGEWKIYFDEFGMRVLDDNGNDELVSGIVSLERGGLGEDASLLDDGLLRLDGGDVTVVKINSDSSEIPLNSNGIAQGYDRLSLWTAQRDIYGLVETDELADWRFLTEPLNEWGFRASGATVVGIEAADPTVANSESNGNDASGTFCLMPSTGSAGNIAGFPSSTFNLVRLGHFPDVELFVRTPATITNLRYWIGLSSADVTNVDDLVGVTEFAGFRFSTVAGDTGWRPVTRDGATQNVEAALLTVTANTTYRLRIRARLDGAIEFLAQEMTLLDAAAVSTSSNLPATSTDLGFVCRVIPTTASQRDLYFGRARCRYNFL